MDHWMHGKLKAAANPFAFEEYRKKRIHDRLDAKRTMRTKVKKSTADVNKDLHRKLQVTVDDAEEEGVSKKRREAGTKAKGLLADECFQALFADPDFAIDNNGPQAESGAPGVLRQAVASSKG